MVTHNFSFQTVTIWCRFKVKQQWYLLFLLYTTRSGAYSLMLDIVIIVWPVWLLEAGVSVTKFSHPLTSPWTPGSFCVSQQSSALPPTCLHETQQRENTSTYSNTVYVHIVVPFRFLFLLLHSPLLHLFMSPQLPSLLPDLSSLPSCPLTASCSGSYHSRKHDTVSAQSNQH